MKKALRPGGIISTQGRFLFSFLTKALFATCDVPGIVRCISLRVTQKLIFPGECLWLHMDLIKGMLDFCKDLYPVVDYAYCTIPTYPSGQIGFVLCSTNAVSLLAKLFCLQDLKSTFSSTCAGV